MSGRFIRPTSEEERQIAEGITSDPDAAPDMSVFHEGITPRPDLSFTARRESPTSVLIDKDVVAHFRSEGPDWQARINEALRKAAGL